MGALGDVINNTIATATQSYSGSTLAGFLTKFSDSQGRKVNIPDALNTFEVKFQFFPCAKSTSDKKDTLEKVGAALLKSAQQATSNLANSMTGGLVASLMSLKNKSIEEQRKEYSNRGKYSFLDYLTIATMMDQGEATNGLQTAGSWLGGTSGSPTGILELDMSYYTQEITVPQINLADGGQVDSPLGKFPVNGSYVQPASNELQFTFMNTVMPVCEFIFYPWLREVTLPYWSYETQPYTTATITIDFSKHADLQYVFTGCRPKSIYTTQPSQQNGDAITRQVTFMFDFMFVTSREMEPIEQWDDKLLDSGKALFNSASKMMNF